MSRKTILIIVGVIVALCVVCAIVVVVAISLGLGVTQPAASAGDSFMGALRDGKYTQAYDLCTPALQKELGNAQDLESRIKEGNVVPTGWNFTSREITGDTGQLSGDVTFTGNRPGTVELVAEKVGNDWKISGFHLKEK